MPVSVWAICCMAVEGGRCRGGYSAIAGLSRARPQAAPLTVVQPSVGHGLRTGTDNLPILNHVLNPQQQVGHGPQPQDYYSNLNTPSVWRTARSHAAAKVEALSSNGMDEIEIPAFLRKQAD